MAIIINEFLPVPNIASSSHILLRSNLSYVIYFIGLYTKVRIEGYGDRTIYKIFVY